MRAAAISGCSVIAGLQVLSLSPYQQRSRLRDLPQFVALPALRAPSRGLLSITWLAMCYDDLVGGTLRGRPTPRFRTIQVCPKDPAASLWQAEVPEKRPTGRSAADSA
jgi:hypothetical protein